MYRAIRSFFDERGYLEVFTPTLSPSLIPEPTIKSFETEFINPFEERMKLYMIPSPEIFMKEMIANGSGSIYQISNCFRNSEQLGDVHNPEFSMLEYYSVGMDEVDSIKLTKELLNAIPSENENLRKPFLVTTMRDIFLEKTKIDLDEVQDEKEIRKAAESLGIHVPGNESWDDTFNRIFINNVECDIPKDVPVVITDYPKQIECLAKDYTDRPYKKRWEMYIDGVEVANCYDEETDKGKIKGYYVKEYEKMEKERKGTDDVIPAVDMAFADLEMKKSSGVAIGLDRLLMTSLSLTEIRPLLSFPLSDMLTQDN